MAIVVKYACVFAWALLFFAIIFQDAGVGPTPAKAHQPKAQLGAQMRQLVLDEWDSYKVQHGKNYENDEEDNFRFRIYMENRHLISEHNQHSNHSFKLGLNKYSDMLSQEFTSTMNRFLYSKTDFEEYKLATFIAPHNSQAPGSVNWVSQGAVTNVKDQGQCGSCWAFSATGALEGQEYRKTRKLISLSEQNLVDCAGASKYGCHGCEGGNQVGAFYYIRDNNGIDTETSYPYEGHQGKCRYNAANRGGDDTGAGRVREGDEVALLKAVATIGPISVAIDASHRSFQQYRSGVYYEPKCSSSNLDHGVLVVGYGEEGGQKYWLVKNSWGTSWGDGGYIKMARDRRNNCGIATFATYPIV